MGEHVFMLQPVDILNYPREIRIRTDTMDGDDTMFL